MGNFFSAKEQVLKVDNKETTLQKELDETKARLSEANQKIRKAELEVELEEAIKEYEENRLELEDVVTLNGRFLSFKETIVSLDDVCTVNFSGGSGPWINRQIGFDRTYEVVALPRMASAVFRFKNNFEVTVVFHDYLMDGVAQLIKKGLASDK